MFILMPVSSDTFSVMVYKNFSGAVRDLSRSASENFPANSDGTSLRFGDIHDMRSEKHIRATPERSPEVSRCDVEGHAGSHLMSS